jgi:hypothetical protein
MQLTPFPTISNRAIISFLKLSHPAFDVNVHKFFLPIPFQFTQAKMNIYFYINISNNHDICTYTIYEDDVSMIAPKPYLFHYFFWKYHFSCMPSSFTPTFPGTQLEHKTGLPVILCATCATLACSQPECNDSTKISQTQSSQILHYSKISSHFHYRTTESIINRSANGAWAKCICKFDFILPRFQDICHTRNTAFQFGYY